MSQDELSRGENQESDAIAVIKQLAVSNDWEFDECAEGISLYPTGANGDYQLVFQWMNEAEILCVVCAFECKIPKPRHRETLQFLNGLNEVLDIGHFTYGKDTGLIAYTTSMFLPDGLSLSEEQGRKLINTAAKTADDYRPAFKAVALAGMTATETLQSYLMKTVGNA